MLYDCYYSEEWQRKYPSNVFYKLETGEIVQVTEAIKCGNTPLSPEKDLVFVGVGDFSHFGCPCTCKK